MANHNSSQNKLNRDPIADKETLRVYEESDHFTYLIYHKDCRALVGKANVLNRFDDWETICHNCKRIMPISQIKFVRIEKKNKS